MSGIEGKVVAITGASSGIGEATARRLAKGGAQVVLGARRTARLDEVAEQIRAADGQAATVAVDVTRREDLARLVATAVDEFGRLDVLVGNAGISPIGPVANLDVDAWDAMIEVNLRGALHGIAAALPVFRRQGRGHLVSTVSVAGLKSTPGMAIYGATKNAVRTVFEGMRTEATGGWLRTTAISPGYVRTELAGSIADTAARERVQQGMDTWALDPDAVARAIAFAIEQPDDVEIGDLTIRPTVQN